MAGPHAVTPDRVAAEEIGATLEPPATEIRVT
jgi:hypothetical protein